MDGWMDGCMCTICVLYGLLNRCTDCNEILGSYSLEPRLFVWRKFSEKENSEGHFPRKITVFCKFVRNVLINCCTNCNKILGSYSF